MRKYGLFFVFGLLGSLLVAISPASAVGDACVELNGPDNDGFYETGSSGRSVEGFFEAGEVISITGSESWAVDYPGEPPFVGQGYWTTMDPGETLVYEIPSDGEYWFKWRGVEQEWDVSCDHEPVFEILTESRILTEDHVGGIHIKEDDVTLDCDGYSIFWTPGDEDAGVLVEGVTGVTVRDCVIDGFDNGVLIAGSRDVLVTNTVSYSIVNGFFVGGYHPDFPDYESHHVTLKDNEATGISDGEGIGFYVEGGHDITLKGNVATGLFDNGFRMWGPSRDNLLVGNRAEANGSHGFEIQGFYDDGTGTAIPLMHNVLKGNISIGNGILHGGGGFQVGEFSTMNVLKDNWASANMGPGFGLVEGANLNELIGNTARDNVHGFSVFDSADNALRDNTAVDNEEYGFEVAYGADGNFLGGNTSTGNGFDGILVLESNGIVLHDNRVIGNGQSGIAVWASEDGAITDNTSRKNQWNGFAAYVTDGPLSEFSGNKACHNGEHDGADFSPAFGGDTATWIDNKFCESLYIWAP